MASPDIHPHHRATFSQLPLFGAIARTLSEGNGALALLVIVALVVAWGAAFVTWGLPGLYLPAVLAAPVAILALIGLTRG